MFRVPPFDSGILCPTWKSNALIVFWHQWIVHLSLNLFCMYFSHTCSLRALGIAAFLGAIFKPIAYYRLFTFRRLECGSYWYYVWTRCPSNNRTSNSLARMPSSLTVFMWSFSQVVGIGMNYYWAPVEVIECHAFKLIWFVEGTGFGRNIS